MKIRNYMLSLGAMSSIIAPIATVVACGNNKKAPGSAHEVKTVIKSVIDTDENADNQAPKEVDAQKAPAASNPQDDSIISSGQNTPAKPSGQNTPAKLDYSPLKTSTAFSIDSLKKDAQEIKWDISSTLWKNGFLTESLTSFINFVMNLAEEYGYESQVSNSETFVITDEMVKQNTEQEVLEMIKKHFSAITIDEENLKKVITSFFAYKSAPFSEDAKKHAHLTGGNQTFDGTDDLSRANLENNADVMKLTKGEDFKVSANISGEKKFATLQWYEVDDELSSISGTFDGGYSLTRVTRSKNFAPKYPVILDDKNDQTKSLFVTKYGIFVQAIIEKIVTDLASSVDMLPMVGISTSFVGAINFLIDQFSKPGKDENGWDIKILSLPSDFISKIQELNKRGAVNFLALKALYLGYDKSFSDSYPILLSSDWSNEIRNNGSSDVPKGLNEKDSMSILTNMNGGGWAHMAWNNGITVFNPILSRDENYQLNNLTP